MMNGDPLMVDAETMKAAVGSTPHPNPLPDRGGEGKVIVKKVASFEELQAECERAVLVKIPIRGVEYHVEVRRLRPDEEAQLDLILSEALPPRVPAVGEQGQQRLEFDFGDPEYQKKNKEAQRVARAMGLWWCFPLFKNAKNAPSLKGDASDRGTITEWVQRQLTERALEHLWAAVRGDIEGLGDGQTVEERVGFI